MVKKFECSVCKHEGEQWYEVGHDDEPIKPHHWFGKDEGGGKVSLACSRPCLEKLLHPESEQK